MKISKLLLVKLFFVFISLFSINSFSAISKNVCPSGYTFNATGFQQRAGAGSTCGVNINTYTQPTCGFNPVTCPAAPTIKYLTLEYATCPVGSVSASSSTCSCSTGYTENAGQCVPNTCNLTLNDYINGVCTPKCVSPQVRNSSGVCETPTVCEAGKKRIIPLISAGNCTNSDCQNPDKVKISPQSTLCYEGCVYDRLPYPQGTIHECYSTGTATPYEAYCTYDFVNKGQSCSFATAPTHTNKTPLESTSAKNEELNASGTSTANPNNNGSNTNANSAGNAANPSASGTSTGANQPSESTQASNNTGGAPCTSGGGDCASEDTLRDIRDAVTNGTGTDAPNITGNEITSSNLRYELTKDSKLQNLLRFEIPAHNGQCPTLDLSIPYLNTNLVFNSHCTIAAPQFDTIRVLSIASWIFLAVMVILGA